MIFNQFFNEIYCSYTYLISSGKGREALIIDPVIEKTKEYILYLKKLDLKLVKVIDTHIHADHVSGLKELNKQTNCALIMGEKSPSEVVHIKVKDNEKIKIENIELTSMYTPGHTDCSYSFFMKDMIFTGDTLLINGTGRTDFQNGNPVDQYYSLFERILKFSDSTIVFPAHDYKGKKSCTIGKQKKTNPRLQVNSKEEYINIMNNLKLDQPTMMGIAVPANIKGMTIDNFFKLTK